jgi:predicted kinase
MKVTILKGLPASGKSTFAKALVDSTGNTKRINKDDLRSMLDNSKWSKNNEKFILTVRDNLIHQALENKFNVIVDDTNLHPKHVESISAIAKQYNAKVEVKFIDTPLEECIKRDLKRPNSVGQKVILDMYNTFLKPQPKVVEYNPSLPDCYIFDIDGTLAEMHDRKPYEWSKVGQDKLNVHTRDILTILSQMKDIIIFSGRDSVCRAETEKWLYDNKISYKLLGMRTQGDMRSDSIVKEELYNEHIKDKYNVLVVFDDRDSVVKLWRELGINCYQVNYGDF